MGPVETKQQLEEAREALHELSELQVILVSELAAQQRRIGRQKWWNRGLLFLCALVLARLVTGCAGAPFEQENSAGSAFAGAEAGAVSIAAGGAFLPSGGAGGVAGSVAAGNSAGNSAGSGGDAPAVQGGAGGEPSHVCDRTTWRAAAFASSSTSTPALAVDGNPLTRWQSGANQEKGQAFTLELGAPVQLLELELQAVDMPSDVPSSLELELDGQRVDVAAVMVAPGWLRLSFDAPPASTVRLELTSSAPSWWSIAELGGLCQ